MNLHFTGSISSSCLRVAALAFCIIIGSLSFAAQVAPAAASELPGDRMLAAYFKSEIARLEARSPAAVTSLAAWQTKRAALQAQLQEMLGLAPWPERTDLRATVVGRLDHPEIVVEKLHFQSRPGVYVTGNLYLPKNLPTRAPAILYVCGHAGISRGPVAYGAKSVYQAHPAWLARHGYVVLVLDTLEVGDITGLHKGTKREEMWWWNARGYTPAGVETWNAIRALDYLQSRPEVDPDRLGMTGRSGGGVTTWFTAALDERVKVAVPVAGITDLRNHLLDRCIANHCDCAYHINTYRWDNSVLPSLIAPRPLLLASTDKDPIFPMDGVLRLHARIAGLYGLHQATDQFGLLITEGGHTDMPELQVGGLRWFNRFLRGKDTPIGASPVPLFERADLAVFAQPPPDERNTNVHEFFVPAAAESAVPVDATEWSGLTTRWLAALREKAFAAWPVEDEPLAASRLTAATVEGVTLATWEFTSQGPVRLPLFVFSSARGTAATPVRLHVLDAKGWDEFTATQSGNWRSLGSPSPKATSSALHRDLLAGVARGEFTLALLAPRGVGPTRWTSDNRSRLIALRSFMTLGQTAESMRVWDIQRAVAALRQPALLGSATTLELSGERHQAVNVLYASLFLSKISRLHLISPPNSHRAGPDYLNVLRFLDVPQALALAAARTPVTLTGTRSDEWPWTLATARRLGWTDDRLRW